MHTHNLKSGGLVQIEGAWYVDIEFTFSGQEERKLEVRLLFCLPSLDPVAAESMVDLLGSEELLALHVQVVSFYDRKQEEGDPNNVFSKPDDAIDLNLRELNYLYSTLVDFMLKVSDNERIQVLYFAAENEKLNRIYPRYVKRFTAERKLTYLNNGACYAIRTQHYPEEG